jgi:hypothetical protein
MSQIKQANEILVTMAGIGVARHQGILRTKIEACWTCSYCDARFNGTLPTGW